jgi:hypothetical protein
MQPEVAGCTTGRAPGRSFQDDSFIHYMARKIDMQRQQFGVKLPPPPPSILSRSKEKSLAKSLSSSSSLTSHSLTLPSSIPMHESVPKSTGNTNVSVALSSLSREKRKRSRSSNTSNLSVNAGTLEKQYDLEQKRIHRHRIKKEGSLLKDTSFNVASIVERLQSRHGKHDDNIK